jgi:hypothetical protein
MSDLNDLAADLLRHAGTILGFEGTCFDTGRRSFYGKERQPARHFPLSLTFPFHSA